MPLDDAHLALLGELSKPTGEASHDLVFPAAQLREIDLWLAELDAVGSHFLGLGDHTRGMQQRL